MRSRGNKQAGFLKNKVGLFAVQPVIPSVGCRLMARNFCWDAAFCLPSSPANTMGIPVLWTDRHVLLAFLGDEYP